VSRYKGEDMSQPTYRRIMSYRIGVRNQASRECLVSALSGAPRERLGGRGGHPLGGSTPASSFPEVLNRHRLERVRPVEAGRALT